MQDKIVNPDQEKAQQAVEKKANTQISKKASGQKANMLTRLTREDAVLLTRAIELEETDPPTALKSVTRATLLLVIGFIVWASVTPFTEKAAAPGSIIPSEQIQNIDALDNGTLTRILVTDGERVEAGTLLAQLDQTEAAAQLDRLLIDQLSARLTLERATALSTGRPFNTTEFNSENQVLVSQAIAIYESETQTRQNANRLASTQIETKKAELSGLSKQTEALEIQTESLSSRLEQAEALLRQGSGTRTAVFDARQRLAAVRADQGEVEASLARLRQEVLEAETSRDKLISEQQLQDRKEITEAQIELGQLQERIRAARDLVARRSFVAQNTGIVSGLTAVNVGQFMNAGDRLATIVPVGDQLLAEVQVSPKDIGFVKEGLAVLIRVDGYRYGRVGGIQGQVVRVSADTFGEEQPYFKAWVNLSKNYVGEDPAANRVVTGMTVIADIQTGEKSLMAYLLRPIQASLQTAFSER